MLFVGMPTPFKETWRERHRHRLDVPVIMGVGGSFDVLAGFIKRAPRWAQSGAGVVLAAPDGAPQAVEALLDHQQRVHLARRPGDRRPPPGPTTGHRERRMKQLGRGQRPHRATS